MTTTGPDAAPSPAAVIKRLAILQKLTLDAVQCAGERELAFLVLNRTAGLVPYDRATLWHLSGSAARLAGTSGKDDGFAASPAAADWQRRIDAHLRNENARRVGDIGPPDTDALWLPLPGPEARPYAALLLERFSEPAWQDDDLAALRPLARAYGGAFRIFARSGAGQNRTHRFRGRRVAVGAALAVVLLLVLVRLPLRIVAPCEVAPARLVPVNAPLDGVVRDVLVRPGERVSAGDTLYMYDDTVVRQELDVSLKQVDVTRSNLERAAAQARTVVSARAEAVMLQNRLAQDLFRLRGVRDRMAKLTVTAPEDGVVIMGNPAEFAGRPVAVGEAVLMLADPRESLVRIRLPLDDRIRFDPARPVRVLLNAEPDLTLLASLDYVAPQASTGDDGAAGFLAEATWREGTPAVNLGLKGTAVVYGEKVSLGYWLFRKPLATVRRVLGI
ncbi:MAG: HlyD family efflux transporter periplasmic adaptor subunit [Planctomycetes bacterium]|nr:HlyD family efflux transporter periplasmic adaptor subunit [Planctomycetota bacterium]MCC8116717.1 HlyD family efflux transporter periplasmic adaptor subunit [Planctomycetota bacterium]